MILFGVDIGRDQTTDQIALGLQNETHRHVEGESGFGQQDGLWSGTQLRLVAVQVVSSEVNEKGGVGHGLVKIHNLGYFGWSRKKTWNEVEKGEDDQAIDRQARSNAKGRVSISKYADVYKG